MIATLAEAKEYLRVDDIAEDALIENLLKAAQKQCEDISRLETEEFEAAGETAKIATLFTLGYLYEHREEANHSSLNLTLRSLLFGLRKAAF
ncbi:MAG: phage gp6-like head-tail connector protein [Selenomonadaceae bacterium]|nr:phage gp6-like head-tail connector protein [Selenomonadaceae bacterium]